MKKLCFALAMLFCVCCLGGCGISLHTVYLHEDFPPVLDGRTLLPLMESATVTRVSDGASLTVSGTDVEELMLCFENIQCTKKKGGTLSSYAYTVEFSMVDADAAYPTLYIGETDGASVRKFSYGEYVYETIHMIADISYILALFSPAAEV